MITLKNEKLSTHFSLYEVMEGRNLPAKAREMNWKAVAKFDIEAWRSFARNHLEYTRKWINDRYKSDTGSKVIRMVVLSGYRCLAWEKHKKRSGTSQHTKVAVDWRPDERDCSAKLAEKIMADFHDAHENPKTGYRGGLAIAEPKTVQGVRYSGFIHQDPRPIKANGTYTRWTYPS